MTGRKRRQVSNLRRDGWLSAVIVGGISFCVVFAWVGYDIEFAPPALRPDRPAAYVASTRALIDQGIGDASVTLPIRRADLALPAVIAVLQAPEYKRLIARDAGLSPGDLSLGVADAPTRPVGEDRDDDNAVVAYITPLGLQPTFLIGARAVRAGDARRVVDAAVRNLRDIVLRAGVFPQDAERPVSLFTPGPPVEGRDAASGPGLVAWIEAALASGAAFLLTRSLQRRGREPARPNRDMASASLVHA